MTLLQTRPDDPSAVDLGAGSGPEWLDTWLADHTADVIGWRRAIHAHPELARAERMTTELCAEVLRSAGLRPRLLPGTGLICDVGSGSRTVALRADMDALPLHEHSDLPFASRTPGIAHMCGHDAHTAVLLGAGVALASVADRLPGRVRLVFQPAEEVQPGGALEVIAADGLTDVDRIFALHCDPRLEVGRVGTRVGPITSACDMLELRLTSPGGHTSRPHLTADLVHALGTVITGLPDLLSRRIDPRSGTVLVWGQVDAGHAANAVPEVGTLSGTLRTAQHATWNELEPLVRQLVTALLAPTGVGYVLEHRRGVPPVVNDAVSADLLARAAERAVGPGAATDTEQSSGGEDFGWYLEHVPGAMGRLGVWSGEGPQSDIHQPTFRLDERALPVGVRTMVQAALLSLEG
ncbi:amidohydrolase [Actinomycetospora sp. OC33-EN08]|uniref:Amidohydrolase n=1 Tax=Actinomycetospora aurantiaca TaxID=3129233 RepID=A0ABU8MV01_9PSEU